MINIKRFIIFLFMLLSTQQVFSQSLILDTTFSVNYNFTYRNYVSGLILEADNSFLIHGWIGLGSLPPSTAVKFLPNGNVDNNFLHGNYGNYIKFAKKTGNYYYLAFGADSFHKLDYLTGLRTDTLFNKNQSPFAFHINDWLFRSGKYGDIDVNNVFWASCGEGCLRFNPLSSYFLGRFNADGTSDTTFYHDVNGPVLSIKQTRDSSMLIAGNFTNYDTISANKIVKVDLAGNFDPSLQSIFTSGDIFSLLEDDERRIYVTGRFTIQNILDTLTLIRLHANGELDSSFNIFKFNPLTLEQRIPLCRMPDGGWIMGGRILKNDTTFRYKISKTDENGIVDTNYFKGSGFENTGVSSDFTPYVSSITKSNDDYYYVTGFFNSFDGRSTQPIVRLKGLTSGVASVKNNEPNISVYPNPANDYIMFSYIIEDKNDKIKLVLQDIAGRQIFIKDLEASSQIYNFDTKDLLNGMYFYSIKHRGSILKSGKVVVQH